MSFDIFQWAQSAVDRGEIAFIIVRGDGPRRVLDGFTFAVLESAYTDGVPTEEVVRTTIRCHRLAAKMDHD